MSGWSGSSGIELQLRADRWMDAPWSFSVRTWIEARSCLPRMERRADTLTALFAPWHDRPIEAGGFLHAQVSFGGCIRRLAACHPLLRRALRRQFSRLRPVVLAGGGERRHPAGRDLGGARQRAAGWRGARLRPAPALHLQQDVRAVCHNPGWARAHQWRPRDAAAARRAALEDRAAVWRAASDPGRDLGARDRFRQGRHGQAAGVPRARDAGA